MILLLAFTLDSEGKMGESMGILYSPNNLFGVKDNVPNLRNLSLVGPENIFIFPLM